MITERAFVGWFSWARIGAALVVAFLCLPLFVGLDQEDLRNDEAIYSYAVDRVLETNQWLIPRAIPFDGPFLEKPPLKIWLVAGLIRTGLVPHDERGLRFVDALFGALSFLYVYALGCLLAGPICGVVAVLVLFSFDPLLLEHGLRSNNMEAALLLAYCGGLYHLARWSDGGADRGRAAHAFAVGGYVALGFMTKFVAVFFLPIIGVLALAWRADAWQRWRTSWRTWIGPVVLAVVLCAPWFILAWMRHGRLLWNVMLGQHVYTRFTAALDPQHLQPWSFYVVEIWKELARDGSQWFVAAGLIVVAARAWTGRPWIARLVILWFVVPVTLVSLGTSKLFHYAYPFLPPLALAAGAAVAAVVAAITGPRWHFASTQIAARAASMRAGAPAPMVLVRRALMVGAIIAFVVAAWTAIDGRLVWQIGGGRFSNASVSRPLIVGAVLFWLGAAPLVALHQWAVLPLLVLLVAPGYEQAVERLRRPNHPLRTIRDCALDVQHTSADAELGVYNAAQATADHPYYYYLRALGPWKFAERPAPADVRRRLVDGAQTVLVSRDDFGAVVAAVADGAGSAAVDRASLSSPAESRQTAVTGVMGVDNVIVILPGPYQACVGAAVAAGWRAVGNGVAHEVAQ